MMHSVIRRSPSIASSTVADPSTVTVRIESASTSDLNVQDVVTTSSSSEEDELQESKQPCSSERFNYRISSATNRRHTSALGTLNTSNQPQRPSRLKKDKTNSMQLLQNRPTTAGSLPAKSTTFDNDWDIESKSSLESSIQRRNPSYPLISQTSISSKNSCQAAFTHQPVPNVFTTTSVCLGTDIRPQPRRDIPRRSQPLTKSATIDSNSTAQTSSIVFLTDEILLGSIRALQNERQLCKLSVDYLIDATNMRPDELARKANVGARLQCHCGHTHSRCTLTLEFDQLSIPIASTTSMDHNNISNSKLRESNRAQLSQIFSAVNRFILKAHHEDKRILIYGFELTPDSPLAVIAIQYLMLNEEQLSLTEATYRIHRLFAVMPLPNQQYPLMEKRFQDYLKQLERKKFPRNFNVNNSISDLSTSSGHENRPSTSRDMSSNSSETTTTTTTTTTNSTPVTSWTAIPMSIANNDTNTSHQLLAARSAWDS